MINKGNLVTVADVLNQVWSKEDGWLALETKPFEKKPGQPGDRRYAT